MALPPHPRGIAPPDPRRPLGSLHHPGGEGAGFAPFQTGDFPHFNWVVCLLLTGVGSKGNQHLFFRVSQSKTYYIHLVSADTYIYIYIHLVSAPHPTAKPSRIPERASCFTFFGHFPRIPKSQANFRTPWPKGPLVWRGLTPRERPSTKLPGLTCRMLLLILNIASRGTSPAKCGWRWLVCMEKTRVVRTQLGVLRICQALSRGAVLTSSMAVLAGPGARDIVVALYQRLGFLYRPIGPYRFSCRHCLRRFLIHVMQKLPSCARYSHDLRQRGPSRAQVNASPACKLQV